MSLSSKKIIEICGLPGSGKTTFARQIAEHPDVTRILLTTKLSIISYFLLGYVQHPISFTWGCVVAAKHSSSIADFWNIYMYRYARYGKAIMQREAVCILDEGPKQGLYNYARLGVSSKKIKKILKQSPKVHLTLILKIDEDVRQNQLCERRKSRGNIHTQDRREVDQELAAAQNALKNQSKISSAVVHIDSVSAAKKVVQQIL